MNSLHRIKEAQRLLDLNNRQMSSELRVSEFWLSKVLNGHRPPSADLMLRLDDLVRRKGVVLTTNYDAHAVMEVADQSTHYGRDNPPSKADQRQAAGDLSNKIRAHVDSLLRAAGADVQRLGWIAEQLRQHVSEPTSWRLKERLIHEAVEESLARKRVADTEGQASSKPSGLVG